MLLSGVRVPVQVTPPSLLMKSLSWPTLTLRSARVKPVTASLKVTVTVDVSPTLRALSATTIVAVGHWVSMAKLFESVLPMPALPDAPVTPLLSSVIRLLLSSTLLVGVSIAVQVMPPSLLPSPLRLPLATLRSVRVKPATASLKVIVTRLVSPPAKAVSATTMVAVGSTVLTV